MAPAAPRLELAARQLADALLGSDGANLGARAPAVQPPQTGEGFAALAARLAASALSSSPRDLLRHSLPSRTVPDPVSPVHLAPRQAITTATIPGTYSTGGPDTGTVVGITLGAVGGFLLILWLVYTCVGLGASEAAATSTASVVTRKSRGRSHHHHHRRHSHQSHRGSRTVEVRQSTSRVRPVIVDEPRGVERVVVERETSRRASASRGRPAPGVPIMGPAISSVGSDDDDEVVVIEERSPSRRHSRRGSSAHVRDVYYEERRRSSSRR